MPRNSGHADLPLHTGTVPRWLADRMMVLGTLITESIIDNYGVDEVLVRLSDPLWFQSFGAVMGMDWHSSGITTSVMYALKRGLNPRAKELGLYVCGGRGKYSRQTLDELAAISEQTGLNGENLIRNSKLVAKVDNNALQDGFQLYQHNFILSKTGNWAVVQQGMNTDQKKARRYHWCSTELRSFVEEPHTAIVGENHGKILNLTDKSADKARNSILEMSKENPDRIIREIQQIQKPASQIILLQGGRVGVTGGQSFSPTPSSGATQTPAAAPSKDSAVFSPLLRNAPPSPVPLQGELFPELSQSGDWQALTPQSTHDRSFASETAAGATTSSLQSRNWNAPAHHEVTATDVDLKRLGGVLATAYQTQPQNFEELLLTKGLGPRTLQSLALVSEVIYGAPSRFTDPARFSFAHGGKDGHPFPVPLKIYDESIRILHDSIEKSKLGYKEKSDCIRRLHNTALAIEQNCSPLADFDAAIRYEREHSAQWDGRTV